MSRLSYNKSVLKNLAKVQEKTELKKEKIELGLVQDGTKLARQISSSTAEMKSTFLSILGELDNLEQVRDDTEQDYNKLEKIVNKIEQVNEELGIKSEIPEFKEMFNALDDFTNIDSQVEAILKR
jgi:hypothetical protein